MNSLTRPFKFPKKLWILLSIACFLYLFTSERVNLKDNQTAWNLLVNGEIAAAVLFGMFWLVVAFTFGAFVSTVLGIVRQLLWSEKS